MLLAEANQWPEDSVAYFGQGDECHMSFHFPLMPRLFMAIRMEDRFPIVDILAQTPPIPDNSQWALFLRNHDELTLEMVTDEERDYMYRAYTQDRLARLNLGIRRRPAPLLGNDRRRIELILRDIRKVLAYVRSYESEQILCIVNRTRFLQAVELDLSKWKGLVPVELFSSNEMPVIGDNPYFLTLGPHAFYWFAMQPRAAASIQSDGAQAAAVLPEVRLAGGWESALAGGAKERFESVLVRYIPQRRWFAGKARRVKTATISDVITVPGAENYAYLTSVVIGYADGDPDTYMLPIAYANPAEASHIIERGPQSAIAWARNPGEEARGLLYDALGPANFAEAMLGSIARHKRAAGGAGTLVGSTTRAFARLRGPETVRLEAQLSIAEQSNNSVIFGERLMLKVFRRLEEGVNP